MLFLNRFFLVLSVMTIFSAISGAEKIRVALFLDEGAHARNHLVDALSNAGDMSFSTMDGESLREGQLNDFDVLVVPGGSAQRESISMKAAGRTEVRRFVNKGGIYLGICAGCYLLTQSKPNDLGLLPLHTLPHWRRGKGVLPIELTAQGKEIFGVNQSMIEVLYHNGPVITTSGVTPESHFTVLGYFGKELVEKGGQPGVMVNTPAMFFGRYGKGQVLGISPHPEASESQVNMELNAIRWLYSHRNQ